MKRVLLGLLISLVLSACHESAESGTSANGERFPGFTQAGKTGDSAKLYVDLNAVKKAGDRVQLKLVRELDAGYVIQDAETDCRGSFKALEGVQYRDDGVSDKKYPGDAQPMPFMGKPGIAALVKKACEKVGVSPPLGQPVVEKVNVDDKQTAVESPLPEETPDKLKTRIGLLEIGRSDLNAPPDSLVLDGKVVFKEEDFYLSLYKVFNFPDYDAVLFASNCGGSGCPANDFAFLLVRQGTEPQVVKAENFDAYPSDVKTLQEGNTIQLTLGYTGGKRKLATLEREQLTIWLEDVPPQPLEEEQCQWLHTNAMPACVEARNRNPDCSDPQDDFSGAIMRSVAATADYPGFVQSEFDQQCQQACQNGKASDYAVFGANVCSKLKPENATSDPADSPASAINADVLKGCENLMATAGQTLECMKGNLQSQKDRLNAAYKTLFDALPVDGQTQLEIEQKTWLENRNAECGKLTDETPASDGMGITECIFKTVVKRADELEKVPVPANSLVQPETSSSTDNQGEWYTSTAKPVLVVRSIPDVTGEKIGTVPEGGKIKVLKKNIKPDSISGRSGSWVRIEWQGGIGYVFNIFLVVL